MFDPLHSVPTDINDPHSVQRLNNIPQDRASALLGQTNSMLEEIVCKVNDISGSIRGVSTPNNGSSMPGPECMIDAIKANLELCCQIDVILSGILEVL